MANRRSLTAVSVAFVTCVCLALLLVSGWRAWDARQVQIGEMNVAAENLARAMAQQADDTLHESDVALSNIVERVQHDGTSPAALTRLHQVMAFQVSQQPQLGGIFLYDEHGAWLSTSQAMLLSQYNNADREYFVYHRTHPDTGVHLGAPIVSRSTGEWVLPMSRRINHADGSFAGVVLATVKLSYFSALYETFNIGQHGAVAMLFDDGIVATRRPFVESLIGKDVHDTTAFRAYMQDRQSDRLEVRSRTDGIERLTSYRSLRHYPLFVVAALSKDEGLSDWRRSTAINLGVSSLLALLVAAFGRSLVREVVRRTEAERDAETAFHHLAEANATLKAMATHDSLTGLNNRQQFEMTLSHEFARAGHYRKPLAVVLIDLDRFGLYNKRYGQLAGDQCLRTISEALRGVVDPRRFASIARYGSDQFVVALPNTQLDQAVLLAEQIKQVIQRRKLVHADNTNGFVSISAGAAACLPRPGMHTPETLLQFAMQALESAKLAGRDRVGKALPLSLVSSSGTNGR
jgi:diguanylate cyclase (GGDEF)-like protein